MKNDKVTIYPAIWLEFRKKTHFSIQTTSTRQIENALFLYNPSVQLTHFTFDIAEYANVDHWFRNSQLENRVGISGSLFFGHFKTAVHKRTVELNPKIVDTRNVLRTVAGSIGVVDDLVEPTVPIRAQPLTVVVFVLFEIIARRPGYICIKW